MYNYKQLIADFSSIAYHHPQIQSFGFGDLSQCTNDIVTKKEPKYTRMYMVPEDVVFNQNAIRYNFSIIIMDKVEDDLSNLNDVMSDTLEIQKDIWTILYQSYTASQGNFSWDVIPDENPNIVPFTERFETILGGWTLHMSVEIAFDYNSCTPPVAAGYDFPEDDSFESYKLVLKDFQLFADLHKQINSFGFGDITQLTNDIITKQEPKYPRMYVVPDMSRLHTGYIQVNWKMYFVDRLEDDLSNLQEVLSDQLEIAKDMFSKMYSSEYEADWDPSVNVIYEESETNLAGWVLNVNMIQKFDYNRCVLPETTFLRGLTWSEVAELWNNVNKQWDNL